MVSNSLGDPDGTSTEDGLQREQDLKFEGGAGQHGQGLDLWGCDKDATGMRDAEMKQ